MIANLSSFIQSIKLEKAWMAIFIIWLFQISAMIGISLGYKDWFVSKTPITLILHLTLMLWLLPIRKSSYGSIMVVLVFLGFFFEWIGINHLPIFGEYRYGQNFGIQLNGTPLIIGFNWCILAVITAAISRKFLSNKWMQYLMGASLMVLLDVPMEFVASKFDYWHFANGMPPIENYISWFFIAFLMQILLNKLELKAIQAFAFNLYLANLIFFIYFSL